jgi:hypothetical protein
LKTRAWIDFPLLLNDKRIVKIVFQKVAGGRGDAGEGVRRLECGGVEANPSTIKLPGSRRRRGE